MQDFARALMRGIVSVAGESGMSNGDTLKWTHLFLEWETRASQTTHPIMYISVFPSPIFSPSKEVMSSGGVAEPTFQVMM